jgi:alpha-tubulin suppressor-like RCC1 family protein
VRLPLAATEFSLGNQHGCALLADGSIWCWGENSRGALGLGVLPPCCSDDPKRPPEYLLPQRVRLEATASSIHALGDASCALTIDGEVWCWGENEVGELGAPATPEPLAAPRRVRGLPRVVELVMDEPSCARARNGDVFCWGDGCPLLARSADPVLIDWRKLLMPKTDSEPR